MTHTSKLALDCRCAYCATIRLKVLGYAEPYRRDVIFPEWRPYELELRRRTEIRS